MASTVQTANMASSVEFFDVPSPGNPPKSDPWWKFRRQTPNVVLSKSEERVRWGWANYTRYKKLFAQTDVLTGSLKSMEDTLIIEHQRYLDALEKAMEEQSNAKNGVKARTAMRIAANAKHFQKHSKRFTDTALSEVHARAAGRTHYPSPDAPQSNALQTMSGHDLSLPGRSKNERNDPTNRQGRYQRAPSLGGIGEVHEMNAVINLTNTAAEESDRG